MVQTLTQKRPRTSLIQRKKKQNKKSKKSFNLAEFERSPAEVINGRSFVIYSRKDYDSYKHDQKLGGSEFSLPREDDSYILNYSHSAAGRYRWAEVLKIRQIYAINKNYQN